MPTREERGDVYPLWIGLIFVFNLIVGTGALTLPAVIAKVGWLLGMIFIIILAFISYMTVTFVIESMACANAVIQWRRLQFLKRDKLSQTEETEDEVEIPNDDTRQLLVSNSSIEHTPLFAQQSTRYYGLDTKIELGEMAGMFFNDVGRILFYLCIAIYLYGDLSIYSAAVAKTMRDVICTKNASVVNMTDDALNLEPCWENHTINRLDCYRLSLIAFVMFMGPFTFFNVQKTKYIQLCTILMRWFAFTVMISIAVNRLLTDGAQGHPPVADFVSVPTLFGACIYSFMCHHSLPSLIAPIADKSRLKSLMSFDYILICTFYLCLALTGAFAFANLEDLYTLNFVPSQNQSSVFLKVIEYFLTLFPVFTLSASFPIIAITLRNNLQTLFLDTARFESYNYLLRRVLFPLLALVPPVAVTFFTDSVESLVSFTGSYAGTGIQYIIPIALVYSARKTCKSLLGGGIVNEYQSPFRSTVWLICVLVWAITCVVLVSVKFGVAIYNGPS